MKSGERFLHDVIAAHLNECQKYLDAEVYYKALSALKDAKSADSRNIYVIALEKQVKLLSDLSKKRPVPTATKNEIKATIPEIMRRAIEDSQKRGELEKTGTSRQHTSDSDDNAYIRERELALKKLKNQFISLAEEFISNGDYQKALEEIRRIFIIDPDNVSARELEKKIESLINFQSSREEVDAKKNGKRKPIKIGKALPYIIAFLVVANVIIFFLTSILSDDDPYRGPVSEAISENSSTETYLHGPAQEVRNDRLSQSSNPLPETVLQYRESIAIVNDYIEADEESSENLDQSYDEQIESTLTVMALDSIFAGDIVESDNEELVYNEPETIDPDVVEDRDVSNGGQIIVTEPQSILRLEEPVYPLEAIEQGIQGSVVVRILYDAAGTVNVSFVESSDHPLLSESALKSARMSRFTPVDSAVDDRPQWVTIPYQFRLD